MAVDEGRVGCAGRGLARYPLLVQTRLTSGLDETTGAATIAIRLRIVSAELGRSQVREL